MSLKGFYMNLLPPILCLGVLLLAKRGDSSALPNWVISWDKLAIYTLMLFAIGCFVSSDRSIGRNTMHVLPFLLPYLHVLVRFFSKSTYSDVSKLGR